MSRRRVFAAALALGLAAPSFAAEEDVTLEDVFDLVPAQIATAGARHPQALRDSPSAITVISAEEIRASGATSVPQLLRSVAGVNVAQASASEWSVAVHERSNFPGEGVLTLIDGRAVYLDFFSIVIWEALPITMEEIERIEVVKSPSSALWGANAMNGIINIITKSPEAARGTRFTYTGGDFRKHQATALHGGTAGKWSYRLSGAYDAQRQFPNPALRRTRKEVGDESSKGNALLAYDGGAAGKLTLRAGVDDSVGEVIAAIGAFKRDGKTSFLQAAHDWRSWKFQLYYNGLDVDVTSAGVGTQPLRTDTYDAEFQHSLELPWTQLITWGMNGRFNEAEAPAFIGDDKTDSRWAFFLQDEVSPAEALKLTLGGRFDAFSETRDFVSGRFGAVWTPAHDHVWRLSAGRSFNKPDTIDLFANLATNRTLRELNPALPAAPFTVTLLGDSTLQAERVDALEVGYQNTTFRRVTARLDAFLKHQEHDVLPMIADYYPANHFFPGSPPNAIPRTIREVNAGDGRLWGGEFALNVLVTDGLLAFANYSLQRESGVLLGQSGPGNKANLGARWNAPGGLSFYGVGHYVDARRFVRTSRPSPPRGPTIQPAYVTADARVGWRPRPGLELAVTGFNVFNDKHREFVDADVLERQVLGSVSLEW